jgi:hypothetical protein
MAYRTLGAGMAQIVTPLIVGQLSDPCSRGWKVNGCVAGGWLRTRPYGLVAIFIAAVGVMATMANFFMIPDIRRAKDGTLTLAGGAVAALRAPAAVAAAATPPVRPTAPLKSATMPTQRATRQWSTDGAAALRRSASVAGGKAAGAAAAAGGRAFAVADEEDLDAAAQAAAELRASHPATAVVGGAEAGAPATPPPWWRHRPALLSIFAYAAVTFLFDGVMVAGCLGRERAPPRATAHPLSPSPQGFLDLVYLYASAPRNASVPGLALKINAVTAVTSLGGAAVVLFSLAAYPPLQRRIGVARCCRAGLAAGIPMTLVAPLATYALPAGPRAAAGVLAAGQALYGAAFASTSTASQIMVNLSSPDGAIGAVNGAGNALSASSRVWGPIAIGGLWAVAASDARPDQWLPFGVLAGGFVVTLGAYVALGIKDE